MKYMIHHQHIRKRINKKYRPFPANKLSIRLLDYWVTGLGTIMSLSVASQIAVIYANQDATNISLLTWGTFTVWSYTMLLYGIIHKTFPIILTYATGSILYTLVIIAIFVY